MVQATRTAQGAPCWVSLTVRDLAAAERFYGALCGWELKPGSRCPDPYVLAVAHGVPVAGITVATHDLGLPVSWVAYFHADSADEAAERIRERGATVAVGPVEFGSGRVAWAADPAGAVFAIWDGEIDPAWGVDRAAGTPAWIELQTGDAFAAAIFYGEVFGWDRDPERCDVCYEYDRVVVRIDGRPAAGLCGKAVEAAPAPRLRPRWQVYFRVEDVDDAARQAVALGGAVVSEPADSPFGRVAALRDPEGGLFSVTACGG